MISVISTRIHGILDYLVGILLIISPWIFGFAEDGGAAMWVPIIVGVAILLLSIFTAYEVGAVRAVPMKTHLWIDIATGIFLAASPWIFDFDERVYLPHLIVGIAEVGVAIFTSDTPTATKDNPTTTGTYE